MKQANSTEMDRLLRRHARRWGEGLPSERDGGDGAAAGVGAHLDADEMNAYAEGALPPAAHARYASHLADCDSCRAVVTDLTLAAQVEIGEGARDARRSASPSKSWWSAIAAALFAPPVLRYAVPAVLLLGVIVVALVATRDRNESQFVAQKEDRTYDGAASRPAASASPTTQEMQPNESAGTANNSATTTGKTEADAPPKAPSVDGTLQTNANANRASSAPTSETKPDLSSPARDARQRDEPTLNDGLYANEPTAAPPPPVASRPASPGADNKTEEEKQNREQSVSVTTDNAQGNSDLGRVSGGKDAELRDKSSVAKEKGAQQQAAGEAGARSNARSRRAAKSTASPAADDADRSDTSTETRSVGGRRFRRQGDAWIDTAYSASRSIINLARGSDQYRALAADEPGLRSIAEQLGGVVIVVWKGKAYRIH